ncbi:hypothetical protein [Nakamurella deserti]|uniref:hypothetical protein n=1 Tax=Nakamurella deserti TaxID=2164074 RepID=UPI000DBE5DF6|nr:hypothetical protein [Nakamurella deserti]
MSPEATVHAEIQRRLELAGAHRRYRPVRARRPRSRLRALWDRVLRSPHPPAPAVLATAGRHHLPVPPTAVPH